MNHDPAFKKLRNEITQYLVAEGRHASPSGQGVGLSLPDIEPADLRTPRKPAVSR